MDIGKPEKVTTEEAPPKRIPAPNFVPAKQEPVEVPDWINPNKVTVPARQRRAIDAAKARAWAALEKLVP